MRIVPAHRSLVIVVLAMAMFACSDSGTPSTSHSFNGESDAIQTHQRFDAGFTRRCFRVEESAAGFRIEPPDAASMRNPLAIEIVLRVGEPPGPWPRQNI